MVLTRQARVLGKVDAFVAKESASLVLREATHRAILLFALSDVKEASGSLNSQQTAAEQVRILCTILRANQGAEEQEERILETRDQQRVVFKRQRILREVCNRGRPTLHRDT